MNASSQNSPNFGFEETSYKINEIHNKIASKVLKTIRKRLNIFSSTPYKVTELNLSNMSFSKSYEEISRSHVDNDSGYVSHTQESNFDVVNYNRNSAMDAYCNDENALLEKPPSSKKCNETVELYEEFSHLYYINTIIDDSVSTQHSTFSCLQDSSLSLQSDLSDILPTQDQIVINSEKLDQFKINLNTSNNIKTREQKTICDLDTKCIELHNSSLNMYNNIPTSTALTMPTYVNSCVDDDVNNFGFKNLNDTAIDVNNDLQATKLSPVICDYMSCTNTDNTKINDEPIINVFNEDSNLSNKENDRNAINIVNKVGSTKTITQKESAKRKSGTPRKRKRSLSKTPKKKFINPKSPSVSPDLFSDDETEQKVNKTKNSVCQIKEKYVLHQDKVLLKRAINGLSGVLPPPSFTILNLSAEYMLQKLDENKIYFWNQTDENTEKGIRQQPSSLVTSALSSCLKKTFPQILGERNFGLHYNSSKLSEDFESACMKYGQRYVGNETQSTCTAFDSATHSASTSWNSSSPSKRARILGRNSLRPVPKSPGRRLSHLARRRITFSSANLQAGALGVVGVSGIGSTRARQILVDAKQLNFFRRKSRSPRKTPRKNSISPRKRVRTPGSSAKKRLSFGSSSAFASSSAQRASATKRALFQSPEKASAPATTSNGVPVSTTRIVGRDVMPSTSNSSLSPWKKKGTPKRALFTSPVKLSPSKQGSSSLLKGLQLPNKRKRLDSDDFQPSKLPRSLSLVETSIQQQNAEMKDANRLKCLSRVRSDSHFAGGTTSELSIHHKKKLQWAVYEALRIQNVTMSHPKFREYASTLARVTRRFFSSALVGVTRAEGGGGTTERMLRIAKQNSYAVTRGKSLEEIVQQHETARSSRPLKPIGYVGLQEQRDVASARNYQKVSTVFQDKSNTLNSSVDKKKLPGQTVVVAATGGVKGKCDDKVERVKKAINFDKTSSGSLFGR